MVHGTIYNIDIAPKTSGLKKKQNIVGNNKINFLALQKTLETILSTLLITYSIRWSHCQSLVP